MQRYKKYPFGVGIVNKNRLAASYIVYMYAREAMEFFFREEAGLLAGQVDVGDAALGVDRGPYAIL